ncbi:thiaminase II [Vagococcus intermedius]|uniref:Aminopyrimidine aminohydrolase n=1 Tax=Vagococcus intermedius TaxID=2991418 RepID=A0AAF0I4U1_9ENTE|nr:thiaminase II [Vagococcus intermedius]WEG72538.1 thiaminase II [Vagococcus intermedius]WEG74625.1 thiaminase II [Vagococcus intermedius]
MSFSRSLKNKAQTIWEAGYHHPFVQELGQGTLKKERFQFYLKQDYLYLLDYTKVYALGAVKCKDEELLQRFVEIQHSILTTELALHRQYMKQFDIDFNELKTTPTSLFNRTYTANMLAVGQTGDLAEILATILPCAWTYYDYAMGLKEKYADQLEENFYKSWIEMYANADFLESFSWFFDTLDTLVENKSVIEKQRIEAIFTASVEFEYLFWEMSYQQNLGILHK